MKVINIHLHSDKCSVREEISDQLSLERDDVNDDLVYIGYDVRICSEVDNETGKSKTIYFEENGVRYLPCK
jgi:hypothetical protein